MWGETRIRSAKTALFLPLRPQPHLHICSTRQYKRRKGKWQVRAPRHQLDERRLHSLPQLLFGGPCATPRRQGRRERWGSSARISGLARKRHVRVSRWTCVCVCSGRVRSGGHRRAHRLKISDANIAGSCGRGCRRVARCPLCFLITRRRKADAYRGLLAWE